MGEVCTLVLFIEPRPCGGEVTVVIVCVCVCLSVCLSVTTLAGATRTLRAQLRYQTKALVTRIKTNVGIGLKHLSSKVMTVCSSPRIL